MPPVVLLTGAGASDNNRQQFQHRLRHQQHKFQSKFRLHQTPTLRRFSNIKLKPRL